MYALAILVILFGVMACGGAPPCGLSDECFSEPARGRSARTLTTGVRTTWGT
jgi:hypothetical protein